MHRFNLDEEITQLSQPWLASLPFHGCVIENDKVTHLDDVSDVELQSVDMFHYLNGQKYPTHKLYFSRLDYPPLTFSPLLPGSDLNKVSSWTALKKICAKQSMGTEAQYFLMVEPSNAEYSAAFAITKLGQVVCPLDLPKKVGP